MKYTAWIGIDPGLRGGLAIQYPDNTIKVTPMPITKDNQIDPIVFSIWLDQVLGKDDYIGRRSACICIERQQAMPGQGVSSTYKLGFGTGLLHGIMWEKDLSFIVVDSRKWKNRVLIGTTKDKQAAIDYCLSKFPDISLLATPRSRKHHDGIADAICISEYARHYAGR